LYEDEQKSLYRVDKSVRNAFRKAGKGRRKPKHIGKHLTSKYFALALPIMNAKARMILDSDKKSVSGSKPV
jgi:hypothetical protein